MSDFDPREGLNEHHYHWYLSALSQDISNLIWERWLGSVS